MVDWERQPEWTAWAKASLAAWRGLEEESGVRFFTACGSAVLAAPTSLDGVRPQLEGVSGVRTVESASLLPVGLLGAAADGVPGLALLESNAGYVNPEGLIAGESHIQLS